MSSSGDAYMPEFSEVELEMFLARAAEERAMEGLSEDVLEEIYAEGYEVVLGMLRERDYGIAVSETLSPFMGLDESIKPTLDEWNVHRSIATIADYRQAFVAGCKNPEKTFMSAVGSVMRSIDDPAEIQAWSTIIKEVYSPYVNVDEIMGDNPDIFILQAVSMMDSKTQEVWQRIAVGLSVRIGTNRHIDAFLGQVGKLHHDDAAEFKLCIFDMFQVAGDIRDDDQPEQIFEKIFRYGMRMGLDEVQVRECIIYVCNEIDHDMDNWREEDDL